MELVQDAIHFLVDLKAGQRQCKLTGKPGSGSWPRWKMPRMLLSLRQPWPSWMQATQKKRSGCGMRRVVYVLDRE